MSQSLVDYPDFLIQAAKVDDPDWVYFQCWNGFDYELMDRWLVEVKHPLAFEPGTNHRRFRELMKEIKNAQASR